MEIVADFRCGCAENPLWHPEQGTLYWTDVDQGAFFSLKDGQVYEGERVVGGMTLHKDGRLLLFMSGGRIALWSPGSLEVVLEEIPWERDSRFNDVIADPRGRVFCGTMPTAERQGRLWRLDPDGRLDTVLEQAGQPNGMAFSPDLRHFYFTDTMHDIIFRFDYDEASGGLSHQKAFIRGGPGKPDGLTVDSEGFLWSARWDGGCLVRYDPLGNEVARVGLPVQNVTSVTFVGRIGYVTTAGGGVTPGAGAVFRFEADVEGRAEFRSGA